MSVKEEIREQNKKWKTMTPKEKRSYFFTYYKWHVIITLVLIIAAVILVRDIIRNNREELLFIMAINNSETYMDSKLMKEFAEYAEVDTKQYNLHFSAGNPFDEERADYTSIATIQKFEAFADDAELDAVIMTAETVPYFEKEEYFIYDLKDFLAEDVYKAVEDRLYTYHCESLDRDIAIGFYLKPADKFYERGLFGEGTKAVFIPLSNSTHLSYVYQFLAFMKEI